ncbi:heat shock protein 70-like protein [Diodia vein chlorosis virus]|uniref:Heat shock protein 70-like protein n=1 Tax=Diodia vein chlorosis virus TaxID=656520 RepID=C8CB43_9CLOS|nr:heat shock protein 70-like protein [Diodia vein chlorosis virus]ACU80556.2 heat shock protein 70-like protein [Diodia vein chlorosis virus]
MEAKVGLDFGTTFSTISSYVNGVMHVLKINNSEYVPTCLAITSSNDVIIGGAAQVLDSSEVSNCYFYDLKRWVGVDRINFEIIRRKIRPQYVAELIDNDVYLTGINRGFSCRYTVKQLILLYIETMVRLFSKTDNLNIVSLNVSVPADYKCKQRMFMKSVCDSLNFSLRRIINEPSAAAIYSVSKYPKFKYFLMYDFGGGTFDTSLIVRDGKVVTVADTEGDSFLGGRDIDNAISRYIMKKHSLKIPLSSDFLASIKEEVNNSDKSNFTASDVQGNIVNVNFTKTDLSNCIESFSDRSIRILDNLVSRRKLTEGALFMVGGSSLLKKIQQDVTRYANSKGLQCVIDKDLRSSVSYGCSMQHAQEDSGSMTYIDCNSHPLMDLYMYTNPKVIVTKPMPIPYTKYDPRMVTSHFNTIVNVYEGSDLFVLNNDWLVSAKLDTRNHVKIGETLTFVYKYSIDGILYLYAKNEDTKVEKLLPNTFSLTEKIKKLDLQLTQLSTIDESATLLSIISYFDSKYKTYLNYLKTPTILEKELAKATSLKALYSELVKFNKNFNSGK